MKTLGDLPDDEINKITHENAMRDFQFDPFAHRPKEQCTVGALRAEAPDVDVVTRSPRQKRSNTDISSFVEHRVEGAPAGLTGPSRAQCAISSLTPVIDDAKTLWELLDRRAQETPDAPMLIDEADRTVSFGEFRDRSERVAAGLVGAGRHPGHAGGVAVADAHRVDRAVVRAGAPRHHPGADHPDLPRARGRVGAGAGGREVLRRPRRVAQLRLRGDGARVCRRRRAARSRPSWSPDTLPEGDPSTLPAPPTDGDAVRWLYSTSGTTAAPKCVMHSDGGLIAGGMGLAYALEVAAARRRLDRVPVHAHRRSRLPRGDARATACPQCCSRRSTPRTRWPRSRATTSRWPAAAPRSTSRSSTSSARTRRSR